MYISKGVFAVRVCYRNCDTVILRFCSDKMPEKRGGTFLVDSRNLSGRFP